MKVSSFSVLVSFVALAIVGAALLPLLPVKLAPSTTLPGVTVSFSMPGNSARIIEMEATSKLEAMLARITGVRSISSTSRNGSASINIDLDKHADLDMVRFEASTIVRQTWHELPEGVSYPRISLKRSDEKSSQPFMTYTINASVNPSVIQKYAEDHIKTRLASLAGISQMQVSGATPMEWRINYDSRELSSLGVSLGEIEQAIRAHYAQEHLGTVRYEGDSWIRLAIMPDHNKGFDPSNIMVTARDGRLIRLDQIVSVSHEEAEPSSYFRINGLNSIYLSITAEEQANQLKLAADIKAEIGRIKESLPPGYELHTRYDATEYINDELQKIYVRTGLTILILLLFVLAVSRDLRYLLLIVISLALNLFVAFIFYYLFGLELQLYSLAGITISLSLIIDNIIVMADHIRTQRNMRAFMAILTATLTTIGALGVIFLLDESIRLNLQDFAMVVIINLAVSLLVALLLLPALIDKIGFKSIDERPKTRVESLLSKKRIAFYLNRFYRWQIRVMMRWRKLSILVIVLVFGLPFFLLPEKIELSMAKEDVGSPYRTIDSLFVTHYNNATSSSVWTENVRPVLEKGFGGTLRLFIDKVYSGSYFERNEEQTLNITASMPNGTTLDQMNHLVGRMEAFLTTHNEEIKQFQTNIYSPRNARIQVFFTDEAERSGFPYTLKSSVISQALQLGGGSWGVYGLEDQGFNNSVREMSGNYRIELYGYNYDELYEHALAVRDTLMTNRRIKEVIVNSEFSWFKDDYQEFFFNLDSRRLIEERLTPNQLFTSLRETLISDHTVGRVLHGEDLEQLKISSDQVAEYDIWNIEHAAIPLDGHIYKMGDIAVIDKTQAPQNVAKVNQQYRLCLQYEYIGSGTQGQRVQERVVEAYQKQMPMGYTIEGKNQRYYWGKKESKQYLLLVVIVLIIFFTTSILFNSLRQPLAIIFVIPISYIGVFLAFYLFEVNFDQGGFASFVLLCGITVNSSIYVLNEYNELSVRYPRRPALWRYLRAWRYKVLPIFLTVISTILGFVPFLLGEEKEAFWFPMAVGIIGGLAVSVLGIYLYLPLCVLKRKCIDR